MPVIANCIIFEIYCQQQNGKTQYFEGGFHWRLCVFYQREEGRGAKSEHVSGIEQKKCRREKGNMGKGDLPVKKGRPRNCFRRHVRRDKPCLPQKMSALRNLLAPPRSVSKFRRSRGRRLSNGFDRLSSKNSLRGMLAGAGGYGLREEAVFSPNAEISAVHGKG